MVSRLLSSLDLLMIWGSGIRSIGSVNWNEVKSSMGSRKGRPELREFESPPCVKPRALSRADTRSSTSKREHCFSVYPDHTLALEQDGYRMPIIAPRAAGFRWKRKRRRMVPREEQSESNNATMKFLSKFKKKTFISWKSFASSPRVLNLSTLITFWENWIHLRLRWKPNLELSKRSLPRTEEGLRWRKRWLLPFHPLSTFKFKWHYSEHAQGLKQSKAKQAYYLFLPVGPWFSLESPWAGFPR